MPKRPADARDAREVARKLLKSGAIQAIQKPQTKQDQTSFKRPKGQERKRPVPETNTSLYQPFSATQEEGFQGTNESGERESSSHIHYLYQQLATERDREERGLTDVKKTSTDIAAPTATGGGGPVNGPQRTEKPRAKNTICISGNNITEDYIRQHFGDFGTLINVSMEIEKGRGFVTFSKPESSERAINEMHSKAVGGISLQVQLARRQPKIEPINDASSSVVWSSVGKFYYFVC